MKMAQVEPQNGKYKLGGSEDADLEGIDSNKYNVFTDVEKLAKAKAQYPTYNWFVSFIIKEKDGKNVGEMAQYSIEFNKPDSEKLDLYYYLDGIAHPLPYKTEDKEGKKKIKANLKVGDPPVGHYP